MCALWASNNATVLSAASAHIKARACSVLTARQPTSFKTSAEPDKCAKDCNKVLFGQPVFKTMMMKIFLCICGIVRQGGHAKKFIKSSANKTWEPANSAHTNMSCNWQATYHILPISSCS